MKIFISNSILKFKTRFIPNNCVILPIKNIIFGRINTTIINLKFLNPSKIICENDEIMKIISPYFKNIPVVILDYKNGIEYCGSTIKNKMNYAVITAYFVLFIYSLILNNFIQSIFLLIIQLTIFLIIILWFSDREEWENNSKRIIYT
jgi:hypothetical protein